jgi:ADP-ribose pyrophosphatase
VILAETEDGRILCERQYKHGPRQVILTLPSGSIEKEEEPLVAAKRELLEETGYVSDDWTFMATRITQANAGGSWTHSFLARRCRKVSEPDSGDLEEMIIECLSPAELLAALRAGDMPLLADAAALLPGLQALGILKTG